MANISQHLTRIKSAIYGEEVRGSIHDAIAAMNEESNAAMEYAATAKDSAQASAQAAKASENKAAASQSAAKTSETNAKTSETNAANSSATAASKATAASNSASAAKASENKALASEQAAKTSETNAANSASTAASKATAASSSASVAKSSQDKAAASEANAKASNARLQRLTIFSTNQPTTWYRNKYNGKWGGWAKVYTEADKPTPAELGAAPANHGTHVTYSTTAPKTAGTAAVGTETTVARSDHVHPAQTSVTGNAGTATKLATARAIDGVSFDGSADVTHYGSCATAAATAAKAVDCTGFKLAAGASIKVKFTVTNTAAKPTLNAEGGGTLANNLYSHAGGHYNKAMTTGGTSSNKVGDAFVIGNGTGTSALSNAFRVTFGGAVYGLSEFKTTGADYAEYFEWLDGNPDNEDRVGRFVTMSGKKILYANPGEYILGVVSGQPCIIGNSDEDWMGRWEHDDFGRFIKVEAESPVTEMRTVTVPVLDETGEPTGEVVTQSQEVETGEIICGWDYKANSNYDPSQAYIERKDRPEWDAVGMMGVLAVWDDGTCEVDGYCHVAEGGTATKAEKYVPGATYRVIERVSDRVVKIVFR